MAKECLRAALDRHRDAMIWKVEGLDDEQLRRPITPSGTNLLGLVKHLGGAELGWFCLRVEPHESTRDILDFYARARAAADRAIDDLDLDDLGKAFAWFDGAAVSLRWALVHMLEETVRHTGHMDIARELIDGATGDHRRT